MKQTVEDIAALTFGGAFGASIRQTQPKSLAAFML